MNTLKRPLDERRWPIQTGGIPGNLFDVLGEQLQRNIEDVAITNQIPRYNDNDVATVPFPVLNPQDIQGTGHPVSPSSLSLVNELLSSPQMRERALERMQREQTR